MSNEDDFFAGIKEGSGSPILARIRAEAEAELKATQCAECLGRGFVELENGLSAKCQCWKMETMRRIYQILHIPPAYWETDFSSQWHLQQDAYGEDLTRNDKRAKECAGKLVNGYLRAIPALCVGKHLKFINKHQPNKNANALFFIGGEKSGKSMIAACCARRVIEMGFVAKFYAWHELASIFSDYERKGEQKEIIEEWTNFDFIVLDGFSVEHPGNLRELTFQIERLATARLTSQKPYIITAVTEYEKLPLGSAWRSLLEGAFHFNLPSPQKTPNPQKFG